MAHANSQSDVKHDDAELNKYLDSTDGINAEYDELLCEYLLFPPAGKSARLIELEVIYGYHNR